MKKFIIAIVTVMAGIAPAIAQDTLLQKMNQIKAQNDLYFWNQFSHANVDTAMVNATRRVLLEVNNNRPEELDRLNLSDIMPKMKFIKMQRGSDTRVFAYVEKNLIPDYAGRSVPVKQTPVTVEPTHPRAFVPDAFVQKIVQQNNFYRVYQYLGSLKAQGQVLQFGPLKDVEEYNSLDLILFDMKTKDIVAILGPVTQGESRVNLMTGGVDALSNYPEDMVLAIWYIK